MPTELANHFDVRCRVAHVLQAMRHRTDARWQLKIIRAMRAHVMRVRRRLTHAQHEGAAARCAGWIRREHIRKAHALLRQPVEIRRMDTLRAVAAEIMLEVLTDEPENVRLLRLQGVYQQTNQSPGDESLYGWMKRLKESFHSADSFPCPSLTASTSPDAVL